MENRDRDKLSQSEGPTEAGDINRETSQKKGKENDSSADFGQSIGRSEELNSPQHDKNTAPRTTGSSEGWH
jgi:hypothetical protein